MPPPIYSTNHGGGDVWKLAVITLVGVGLSSCGTLPKGGAGPAIPMARIMEAVRCQIADAFSAGNPDPAGMIDWKVLATVTIDGDSGYETHPGIARVAGKNGNLSWSAPSAGVTFKDDTTRHTESELKSKDIDGLIRLAPCPGAGAMQGLGVGEWLRAAKAGQPGPLSGATAGKTNYHKVYTVEATAGGGLKFAVAEYSISFEGNKANASNTYTIDVRFGPQTGEDAPFVGVFASEDLGLNAAGEFDDFSDLRADRDEKEREEDTIIKVPPGQPIVIGP